MFNTDCAGIDFWFSACGYFFTVTVCWILAAVVFSGIRFFKFNNTLGKELEEKACDLRFGGENGEE